MKILEDYLDTNVNNSLWYISVSTHECWFLGNWFLHQRINEENKISDVYYVGIKVANVLFKPRY